MRVWDDPEGELLDKNLLEELAKRADLTTPRDQIHFLYFPDQNSATMALHELSQQGWQPYGDQPHLVDNPINPHESWALTVRRDDLPINADTVARNRMLFAKTACDYHGVYDGWEAAAD